MKEKISNTFGRIDDFTAGAGMDVDGFCTGVKFVVSSSRETSSTEIGVSNIANVFKARIFLACFIGNMTSHAPSWIFTRFKALSLPTFEESIPNRCRSSAPLGIPENRKV